MPAYGVDTCWQVEVIIDDGRRYSALLRLQPSRYSLSLHSQKHKYIQLCHESRQATVESLSPLDGEAFTLTEWSGRSYEASKAWEGGHYDWQEIGRRFCEPDRFALALWVGDRLVAMCLATTRSRAVYVELIEGDPAEDCPLRGARLEIMLDACANYAQARGKLELQLQPKNDALVVHYEDVYGFERVEVRGSQAYWRLKV